MSNGPRTFKTENDLSVLFVQQRLKGIRSIMCLRGDTTNLNKILYTFGCLEQLL